MVDDAAYRERRRATVALPCAFETAIASRTATCEASVPFALAEREAIGCSSSDAYADCARFASLLRERAAFALRITGSAPLPHAAATKLQCGGVAGLRACVDPEEDDVRRLFAAAIARHGDLLGLPWPEIVAAVGRWQGRRRRAPEGS
ncbi:MAG TPA: hypothetical protein PLM09_03495 [Casimicrobiaceae bacterium]|nr:hypothetical protein [Casimicrobiaceae bacterium]